MNIENRISGDLCFDKNLNAEGISYGVYALFCMNVFTNLRILVQIHQIQDKFREAFGDAIHIPRDKELHMTLFSYSNIPALMSAKDAIDNKSNDDIFATYVESYKSILLGAVSEYSAGLIHCEFDRIGVSNSAIYLKGTEVDSLNAVRSAWHDSSIPAGTVTPSSDTYSTILSFKKPIPSVDVLKVVQECEFIPCHLSISFLSLIRETKNRMQQAEILGYISLTSMFLKKMA